MSTLAVLGLASLGSIGAMAGAAGIAATPDRWRARLLPLLLAFSAGSMLAAAFLGMLPRAYRSLPPQVAGACVLGGLGLMLAIERFSHWHHCHADDCSERRSRGRLILYGDAFHNFVDGIVIAAAFLTSPEVGLAATLAVIAHEVPQEMGDFLLLKNAGWSNTRAFLANAASSLSAVLGGALGFFVLNTVSVALPYVLVIAASSFIYVALADIFPLLHKQGDGFIRQSLWIATGVAVVPAVGWLTH